MTRIEYENKTPDKLGEMQDEIQQLKKQLKHKQSKKFLNCTSCSLLLILFFIVLGALLAAVMAKSGLWQIPVFSDYFYHKPEPVYQVTASKFTEADLISRLQKLAVAEAIKQGKRNNLNVNLDISEAELTALLRSQALDEKIESWQIAVLADSAQLFLKAKSPKNLIVTLDFSPGIKDGKLNLDVRRFKVGDLSMPRFLGSLLVENMGANTLNSLLNSFSTVGKIETINPENHKLEVNILINNLNF